VEVLDEAQFPRLTGGKEEGTVRSRRFRGVTQNTLKTNALRPCPSSVSIAASRRVRRRRRQRSPCRGRRYCAVAASVEPRVIARRCRELPDACDVMSGIKPRSALRPLVALVSVSRLMVSLGPLG